MHALSRGRGGEAQDLITARFADFDRRLDGDGPLGVAVSGGGDSVALLHALKQWGRRPLEVFCVDHGLNPQSAGWTAGVARLAAELGAGFTALAWRGDKPVNGLAAAARTARHGLLAAAARSKGVRVLCLGHTRDDIAEAEHMRGQGSNVSAPRAWSPSPAWPEGRGVFLYRPFLNLRRSDLRAFLRHRQAVWIDDPANDSAQSLRARVRREVPEDLPPVADTPPLLTTADAQAVIDAEFAACGQIAFRTPAFLALATDTRLKLLSAAVVCAGGGKRLPRHDSVAGLLAASGTATLCGARISRSGDRIVLARSAGDMVRHGGPAIHEDDEIVWDGRFAFSPSVVLRAAAGLRRRLGPDDRRRLMAVPAGVRATLPLACDDNVFLPEFTVLPNGPLRQSSYNRVTATCWVLPRFLAVLGLVASESDLARADRPWL